MKRIGTAICPDCGLIDIIEPDDVTIYMSRGLSLPKGQIKCSKCRVPFTCVVEWESAWRFDALGCEVIGFSKRATPIFNDNDISTFLTRFDGELDEFLSIIDSESI
jgi:hypothetical protein